MSAVSRSQTIASASRGSGSADTTETSWPAALRLSLTRLASIRSETTATILATSAGPPLERAAFAELLANALGAAPHLHDLGPPLPNLAHGHLPGYAIAVELLQHAHHRFRRSSVSEAVSNKQAPVPIGLRVGLSIDLAECHGSIHIPALVPNPQIKLQV